MPLFICHHFIGTMIATSDTLSLNDFYPLRGNLLILLTYWQNIFYFQRLDTT